MSQVDMLGFMVPKFQGMAPQHGASDVKLKSSKVISQGRSRSVTYDRPKFAALPRSISLKQPSNSSGHSTTEDTDLRQRPDSGISCTTVSSVSSDDDPPQLPPPRCGAVHDSLPRLHEGHALVNCKRHEDLGFAFPDTYGVPPEELTRRRRLMPSIKRRPKRASSLNEPKISSSIAEYFYCQRCQRRGTSDSKGLGRRGSSQIDKFVANEGKYAALDENYNPTTDDFKEEERIYEEIDDKWLEMVRSMIAGTGTKQGSTETESEVKYNVTSCSQKDTQEHLNESVAGCISSSSAIADAVDGGAGSNTAPQGALNEPNTSFAEVEDIYVKMNGFFCNEVSPEEELVSSAQEDGIYEHMMDIQKSLRDLKVTGIGNQSQSVVNGSETEPCPASGEPEPITTTAKDETIDTQEVMTSYVLDDTGASEDVSLAELAQHSRQGNGSRGRLQLSGYLEQYNTKL